jgi:hypothetical protein
MGGGAAVARTWGGATTPIRKRFRLRPLDSATTTAETSHASPAALDGHNSKLEVNDDDDDDGGRSSSLGKSDGTPSSVVDMTMLYPWSNVQEWALRDNVPKYTIRTELATRRDQLQPETPESLLTAESKNPATRTTTTTTAAHTPSSYVLWRSLVQEVPELAGYPLEFLQERRREQLLHSEFNGSDDVDGEKSMDGDGDETGVVASSSKITTAHPASPPSAGILPYLQDYEFAPGGGIRGTAYGLVGVADGSRIETSAVSNIHETLPRGYARTSDGTVAFELGRPRRSETEGGEGWTVPSAAGTPKSAAAASVMGVRALLEGTGKLTVPSTSGTDDADGFLVRLGALTGIFMAGATAVNMLSHHMTVSVFWV